MVYLIKVKGVFDSKGKEWQEFCYNVIVQMKKGEKGCPQGSESDPRTDVQTGAFFKCSKTDA